MSMDEERELKGTQEDSLPPGEEASDAAAGDGAPEVTPAPLPPEETDSGEPEAGTPGEGGEGREEEPDRPDTPLCRVGKVYINARRELIQVNAGEHKLSPGLPVIVQSPQGNCLGVVHEYPYRLPLACRKLPSVVRKATPDEIEKDSENRTLEKEAFEYCSQRIEEWEIPMKLLRVEFLLDRSKALFFFTAEKRVDFRELVKELARKFRLRIEMRQIGIRDEARIMGGIGPCGMPYCCSTFLREFAPISVKMAKEQNVILNPNKISGGCGRLLCCLSYEHKTYREFSRRLPKLGKKVDLPEGRGKVKSWDIFRETVTLQMPDGKHLTMTVEELKEKMK